MQELVSYIVESLTGTSDFSVTISEEDRLITITLSPDDIGRVIGRGGKTLFVDRAEADALKENEYFVDDLVGLTAYAGERKVGVISEIYKGARAADVIEIKGAKTVMIPYLKRLAAVISLAEKRIIFDEKAFEEVAVYED